MAVDNVPKLLSKGRRHGETTLKGAVIMKNTRGRVEKPLVKPPEGIKRENGCAKTLAKK